MNRRGDVHRNVLDPISVASIQEWAEEVEGWPVGSHLWGHYAERTAAGQAAICRTENVSACHPGFAGLVAGPLRQLASDVAGVDMHDFKDKLNYKQPGGAGFSPHQDALAYPGVGRVMSILVAIDPCSSASGCLFLAAGIDRILETDDRGVVRPEIAASLSWTAAPLAPGDAVCIDGLAPHYSESNRSSRARRVFVASYAPVTEHYARADYYEARRALMDQASADDGRARISTLADFEGTQIVPTSTLSGGCVHPEARPTDATAAAGPPD